jgi:hypothetical protein
MTDGNRTELDADGRHWIAIYGGTRVGGFNTEEDAQRFLDSNMVRIIFEHGVELLVPNSKTERH